MKQKLIFISGWGCDETVWSPIIEKLGYNHCCFRWWECLSSSSNENSLYKFLSNCSKPVILVGWSLGAFISLSAAIQLPSKISGLFLLSPTAKMIADEGYTGASLIDIKAMKLLVKKSADKLANNFFSMCLWPEKDNVLKKNLIKKYFKIEKDFLTQGLNYLMETDIRNNLKLINQPVKIIHGDSDKIINISNGFFLNKHLRNSSITVCENKGHFIFKDNIDSIVQQLIKFESEI